MKRLLLVLICGLALTAQQSKKNEKEKIEFCGHSSSHDCHCLRRTRAVQDSYMEACRLNSKSDKEVQECVSKMPGHCSIVDQYPPTDDEADDQDSAMADRCTMMCKKHDCFCEDGPLCHIGHSASDHDQSDKKK